MRSIMTNYIRGLEAKIVVDIRENRLNVMFKAHDFGTARPSGVRIVDMEERVVEKHATQIDDMEYTMQLYREGRDNVITQMTCESELQRQFGNYDFCGSDPFGQKGGIFMLKEKIVKRHARKCAINSVLPGD